MHEGLATEESRKKIRLRFFVFSLQPQWGGCQHKKFYPSSFFLARLLLSAWCIELSVCLSTYREGKKDLPAEAL